MHTTKKQQQQQKEITIQNVIPLFCAIDAKSYARRDATIYHPNKTFPANVFDKGVMRTRRIASLHSGRRGQSRTAMLDVSLCIIFTHAIERCTAKVAGVWRICIYSRRMHLSHPGQL